MNLRTTAVVAEVAGLVLVLVVITWLEATVTQTRSFWPLIASSAIYIGLRAAMLARKARSR
jgi:uncharacterized membrane protein